MMDLKDKRISVTGGEGFLGRHLMAALERRGCRQARVVPQSAYDLTRPGDVARFYKDQKPEVVIHLAAVVWGIGANMENPGRYFYENAMMGIEMIHQAWKNGVEKMVAIGTICAYPKHTPVPFREEDLWSGYPEETNAPYGLAKKMMLVQCQGYRQQYGLNGIFLLPVNLYGPGDNFDPRTSHVIPALIRKCVEAVDAGADHIDVWGTGKASREFLYVGDAAEGICLATERYDGSEPVNLGAGFEITIFDLVHLIAELTGFTGEIRFDPGKPDGQPRRMLDTTRAREYFGFSAQTGFREGLARSIEWYRAHREEQ